MPPLGDEHPCFTPSMNPQYLPSSTLADPAAQIPPPNVFGIDDYGFMFDDDTGRSSSHLPGPESPLIHFSEIDDGFLSPADAPGVNVAAAPQAAPPVSVGGDGHAAPWSAMAGMAEIPPVEEDTGRSSSHLPHPLDLFEIRRLLSLADAPEDGRPWSMDADMPGVNAAAATQAAPAPAPAPAPEDGRPSGRDADMAEVNAAATQPGPLPVAACATASKRKHMLGEAQRWLDMYASFKDIVAQDLLPEGDTLMGPCVRPDDNSTDPLPPFSLVPFTGPDPKGTRPNQGGWKEKSMKGMPVPGQQQQQRYLGLKKTLELDDDGNGNKWRAYEYTPLLPSDDGSDKLVPAEISVRFEFKHYKPPLPPPPPPPSLKRSRTGAPKDGPKINEPSDVWKHMTRLYVKVPPKDGAKIKKPHYRGMYAICHHCHEVLNADCRQGTNNQSGHLKSCKCNCTHSHSHSQ